MKILLNVIIDRLEDKINRQILIDEKIELADMGEYIIISMKGHKIPSYCLENKDIYYYPFLEEDSNNEKEMTGLLLKDLKSDKILEFKYSRSFNFF